MDASLFSIKTEQALVKKALYDQLINLPNLYYLNEIFKTFLNLSKRSNNKLVIKLIDLDHLGHQISDLLLQEVANILDRLTRKNDIVARVVGD